MRVVSILLALTAFAAAKMTQLEAGKVGQRGLAKLNDRKVEQRSLAKLDAEAKGQKSASDVGEVYKRGPDPAKMIKELLERRDVDAAAVSDGLIKLVERLDKAAARPDAISRPEARGVDSKEVTDRRIFD